MRKYASFVVRSIERKKIITGHAGLIRVNGLMLCGGAVERRTLMLLVAFLRNIRAKRMRRKKKI